MKDRTKERIRRSSNLQEKLRRKRKIAQEERRRRKKHANESWWVWLLIILGWLRRPYAIIREWYYVHDEAVVDAIGRKMVVEKEGDRAWPPHPKPEPIREYMERKRAERQLKRDRQPETDEGRWLDGDHECTPSPPEEHTPPAP